MSADILVMSENTFENAITISFFVGLFVGVILLFLFIYAIKQNRYKNFKMYYLECQQKQKAEIEQTFNEIMQKTEKMAQKTNTTLFKTLYNDLNKFKAYLEQRYRQN